jgi:hypothetical protein
MPWWAVSVLFAFLPILAQAYVPPSLFIVKTLAGKRTGVRLVRIRSTVTAFDGEKATAIHFKQSCWFDSSARTLKCKASDDQGKDLYQLVRKQGGESPLLLSDLLLFDPDPASLTQALLSHGIPVKSEDELAKLQTEPERRAAEAVALVRFRRTPLWAMAGDSKASSQLLIEKETFLPARFLGDQRGTTVDLRFETYRFAKEYPFPRVISLVKEEGDLDQVLIREELTDITTGAEAALPKAAFVPGYTEDGNRADSSVRELIQRYYQSIR